MQRLNLVCVWTLCLVLPWQLAADTSEEGSLATAPTSADLQDLVQELGHPEFGRRREAFLKIWKLGQEAVAAIQEAKSSDNLQVAQAATALEPILLLNELGPDSEIFELVVQPSPDKIAQLCQKGYWELAEQTILHNEKLRQQFQGSVATYFLSQVARIAMSQGDPLQAWPIVRATKSSIEQSYNGADLAIWLSAQLELPLGNGPSLPDQEVLSLLYQGKVEQALELPMSDLVRARICSRYARWEDLRDTDTQDLFLQGRGSLAARAAEAVVLEYAGQFDASEAIWGELLRDHGDAAEDVAGLEGQDLAAWHLIQDVPSTDRDRVMMSLLASGRPNAVLAYLRQTDEQAAFSFYASNSDYEATFELMGLQPDLSNFEQWIVEQESKLVTQATLPGRQAGEALFTQAAHFCSILLGLGFQAEAERYFDILCEAADTKSAIWRNSIALWMSRSEPRAMSLRLLEKHLRRGLPTDTSSPILAEYFPDFEGCTRLLIDSMPEFKSESLNPPPLLETLDRLYVWDDSYFREYGTSIEEWLRRAQQLILEKLANREVNDYAQQLKTLATLARQCDLEELALELAFVDVAGRQTAPPSHRVVAAEVFLQRGEARQAAEVLEQFRLESLGVYDQATIVMEVKAWLLSGQYEKALMLDQSRWMRPLSVTRFYQGPFYSQIVNQLNESAEYNAALEYGHLAYQMSDFASMDFYWSAGDLSRIYEEQKNYKASADALRGPLLESLQPRAPQLQYQVANNYLHLLRYNIKRERIHRAASCIDEGKLAEAEHHMRVGENLQPQDIEMVVVCYPKLVKAGEQELANRLFDSYEATMLQQIETWPNDAMALNNLAWMYSQCDRKLDEALRLVQKAVSVAPHSAVYLDTLAEVHYRSGRTEAAISAMRACVKIDPRERHYLENLERFALGSR